MPFDIDQESYQEGYWDAAEERSAASAQIETNARNAREEILRLHAAYTTLEAENARLRAALQEVKAAATQYLNAFHRPASWARDLFAKIVCLVDEGDPQ